MDTTTSSELKALFAKLAKQPEAENQAIFTLLAKIGEALLTPLGTILNLVPLLLQSDLPPDKQYQYGHTLYQSGNAMLRTISNLITQAQAAGYSNEALQTGQTEKSSSESISELANTNLSDLASIKTLLINYDSKERSELLATLQKIGLQCTVATPEALLQTLQQATQSTAPFQIVVIHADHYDHHLAYLGRTIKTSNALNQVMTCLALSNELLDFEKEQIYFDGFACTLNIANPNRLVEKLTHSWRSWSVKNKFVRVEASQEKNRILLVEDDPIPRKITQWQLTEMGYLVDIAHDGHTALRLLEEKIYDLVFMDIGLPDISGLDVTAHLRNLEDDQMPQRHTPVIGLTIYDMQGDENTGLQAGMDEYIVKPLLPERLKSVLQRWLKPTATT